jgi:hypothetical protein
MRSLAVRLRLEAPNVVLPDGELNRRSSHWKERRGDNTTIEGDEQERGFDRQEGFCVCSCVQKLLREESKSKSKTLHLNTLPSKVNRRS